MIPANSTQPAMVVFRSSMESPFGGNVSQVKVALPLSGRSGDFKRQPMLEQGTGDGVVRRRQEGGVGRAGQRRADLNASEPASVVQLGRVDGQLVAERAGG